MTTAKTAAEPPAVFSLVSSSACPIQLFTPNVIREQMRHEAGTASTTATANFRSKYTHAHTHTLDTRRAPAMCRGFKFRQIPADHSSSIQTLALAMHSNGSLIRTNAPPRKITTKLDASNPIKCLLKPITCTRTADNKHQSLRPIRPT